MAKNITGGIILLLGGSALIALAATAKGRTILDVLTNHIGPGATSATVAGSSSSGAAPGAASGFGSFGDGSSSGTGTGGGGNGGGGAGRGSLTSVADYSKIFGFVGEKAATPL